MRHRARLMYQHRRTVWLRLNVDGVLLALLAFASGLDLLNPDLNDLARELGYVPPMFYLWTTLYLIAGALMMAGFIGRHIASELLGRFLLAFAFVCETFRHGTAFGWTHPDQLSSYLVGAVLIAFTYTRGRVLLAKEPLHIVIGGRER